ncbi:MAG: hypothetical protein V3T49_08710, partial [Dehalococcoidia bacterium]
REESSSQANSTTESGTGILLMIGFSGNPRPIINEVLNSEFVTDLESLRSGTQLELKLELSQRGTTGLLKEIVAEFVDFDVKIQGTQTIPVPTLVFSLTPATQSSSGFLRRRLRRNRSSQRAAANPIESRTSPLIVQPAQSFVPPPVTAPRPTSPISRPQEPETPPKPPGPITLAARSVGRTVARTAAAEARQALSIIWRAISAVASLISRTIIHRMIQVMRPMASWIQKIPGAVSKTSTLMTMSINSIFGSGESDESEKKSHPDSEKKDK